MNLKKEKQNLWIQKISISNKSNQEKKKTQTKLEIWRWKPTDSEDLLINKRE